MAERRMISSNIFEDEWFGTLAPLPQMIWIGLITTVADDQGRFMLSAPLVRSKLFPYQEIDSDVIKSALDEMESSRKLIAYAIDGKMYGQIAAWWRYQSPSWAIPSKFPAPDGWIDRVRYHTTNRRIQEENWDRPGGFTKTALPIPLTNGLGSGETRDIEKLREGGEKEERREEKVEVKTAVTAAAAATGTAYKKFESEISLLTPMSNEIVGGWLDDYGERWVLDAIGEAVKANARKPAYIDAILRNWKANGRNARASPSSSSEKTVKRKSEETIERLKARKSDGKKPAS